LELEFEDEKNLLDPMVNKFQDNSGKKKVNLDSRAPESREPAKEVFDSSYSHSYKRKEPKRNPDTAYRHSYKKKESSKAKKT
jgi:hypothetical protein